MLPKPQSPSNDTLIDEYEEEAHSLMGDLFTLLIVTANAIGIGYLLTIFESRALEQAKMAPWLLARASGITAYLLFWLLAMTGILLSHPWKHRFTLLHTVTRMRFHTLLAIFTLSFTSIHIMTIILDSYANVGLVGAFIPFRSGYRPLAVALGTIGLYAALLTGLSARLRIGLGKRGWLNIHRFSVISLGLIWIHAVFAGTDSPALAYMYLATALALTAFAYSRYTAQRKARDPRVQRAN